MSGNENLIDEFVSILSERTDAPRIFLEAGAYFTVSTLLGRWFFMQLTYKARPFKPNIPIILFGPSRVVRKSTVLDFTVDAILSVDNSIEETKIGSFSPEGLQDAFAKAGKRLDRLCLWIKDEMGGFFKSLKKDYMQEAREIIQKGIEGRGDKRSLRKETITIPHGIFMPVFATIATPVSIYQTISPEDFTSGFLNRFFLVYAKEREKRFPVGYRNKEAEGRWEKFKNKLRKFNEEIIALNPPIPVSISSPVLAELDEFDKRLEEEMKKSSGLYRVYLAGQSDLLLKLCVIQRIARGNFSILMVIEKRDFEKALEFFNRALESAKDLITEVETSPREILPRTEKRILRMLLTKIESGGNTGVKWSKLLHDTGLTKKELLTYIETLVDREDIIPVYNKSKGRGRRGIVFFSKTYKIDAVQQGEPLTVDKLKAILK